MSYQKKTGPLMANSHPGSYCGQDAYTDMFVTEKRNDIHDSKTGFSHKGADEQGLCTDSDRLQRPADSDKYPRGGSDDE